MSINAMGLVNWRCLHGTGMPRHSPDMRPFFSLECMRSDCLHPGMEVINHTNHITAVPVQFWREKMEENNAIELFCEK